jgi:P4 family phage/plasmid primase-like protien
MDGKTDNRTTGVGDESTLSRIFSLNSNYTNTYFSRLERIDETKPFWVSYIRAINETDTTYCFNSYDSYEEFKKIQDDTEPSLCRWNEIIKRNYPIVECYDLDGKANDKERNQWMFEYYKEVGEDKIIDDFLNTRKKFIELYYPIYDSKETILISTACTDTKFSIHITVRNKHHFENCYKFGIFAKKFDDYLAHDKIFTLDLQIYSANRSMRMLSNTKYGQDRFLKKYRTSLNFDDKLFLFSYIEPESTLFNVKEDITHKPFIYNNNLSFDKSKNSMTLINLLPIINSDCDGPKWREVAQSIFNLTEGSDKGLEQFIEWSKKDGYIEFNENDCISRWNSLRTNDDWKAIDYLKGKAKFDNPEQYFELTKKKDFSEPELDLESDVDCPHTHEDIAIYIVKQIEKDCNIYYSNKKKCVYIYNDYSKLFEEKPIDTIMNFISFYMSPVINNKLDYLQNKISKKEDEKLKLDNDLDSKRIKKIDTDIKYLKNLQKPFLCLLDEIKSTPFQKCVLTQIKNRIKDSDEYIESTFNKIKHFLAIGDNKVINLKTLDVLDRTKEHCFTYTTNNIFKKDRPNKEWVYNYISEILKTVNNKFIQCFLTWFGYCMTGETCVKSFFILSGDGDNGKSAFFNVIKKILGKFGIVGNDKVFLLQKSHSVHSDEYLPIIGKRFAYIQEISKNSMFNEKLIKSITGGDGDISVRGCGGTTMEVILDCKLLCICNGDDIPDFVDKQGFTNRVMVIPFKNKFERDPKKLIEIESMKDDIFTELCYYAKEHFYDNNMIIDFSSEISEATNELKENKDSIKQFMDEKIEITLNDKDRIKKDTIYKMYLSYCRINNYDNIKVGKSEFYKALTDIYYLGVYRDREFKCIKFIKDDDFQELTFFGNGVPI